MNELGLSVYILIFVNAIFTFMGFKDVAFFNQYSFKVDKVLVNKDYKRLISSGFLHSGWLHFLMNMSSLYFFSLGIASLLGTIQFFVIYFFSLVAGNLLALYVHRNHGDYSGVGASGAICGLMFGSIALFPGIDIYIFYFGLPGWLFGLIFVLLTISAIKSKTTNIGHEAHLGGGLMGLLIALAFSPSAILDNYIAILLMAVPSMAFLIYIILKPETLIIGNSKKEKNQYWDIEEKYHYERKFKEKELNALLEKISKKGINSLSAKEKARLEELSK